MNRINQIISLISVTLVLFIAVSAFVLSFEALKSLAQTVGINENMSWLYPSIIDGAIIVFSLSVLRANLNDEKTWYPWLLVALFTILSVALNIIHAPQNLLPRFIATIPPIALFLSFELLMSQIKSITQRTNVVQSLNEIIEMIQAKHVELDELVKNKESELDGIVQNRTQTIEELNAQIKRLEQKKEKIVSEVGQLKAQKLALIPSNTGNIEHARKARASKKQNAMDNLIVYLQQNPEATLSQMASAIGRSKSTAGIYIGELQDKGVLSKSGRGWAIQELVG